MIIKKDSEIVKAKVKRKSLVLKAKKESSDEECLTSGSEDEEYAMALRDFKKVFSRRECPKPSKDKNQRAFVRGSWRDSGEEDDENVKNEMCLVAQASRKQAHTSHKAKNIVSTTRCLELLHMDLFGPSAVRSYGVNQYTLVIVDDYTREFNNEVKFGEFFNANGITHNFSAPRTAQSNGVVKRKKRTLQEMSRTMLNEQSLPQKFWCNAIDTSTYILNRILIKAILGKTPYELLRGYSQNSKAYIILNKHTRKVKESLNVTFDETLPPSKTSPLVDDDLDEEEAIKITEKKNLENNIVDETLEIDKIVSIKESRNHPLENVLGNLNQRTLRNKLDENGVVSRNKARLVAQGYNQQERIDYDETYAPVARIESIRILLTYACALDFKLFQMDVKSAFLNGFINEEAPKTSHLKAVKRIFRYIKGTTHLGLWYPKGTNIETVVYADSDHVGDYVDRKSTSVPSDGPYQTNPPSPDDIISSIRIDREGQVRHEEEINVQEYQVLTREIENPKAFERNYSGKCLLSGERKHRKDRGTRRGRHSTSFSTFNQPSSTHLNDDDDDEINEGTSRASTPSPIHYVNSLTNKVP
nr:hypothetical protein [Tanacetum cinerariifolium]